MLMREFWNGGGDCLRVCNRLVVELVVELKFKVLILKSKVWLNVNDRKEDFLGCCKGDIIVRVFVVINFIKI